MTTALDDELRDDAEDSATLAAAPPQVQTSAGEKRQVAINAGSNASVMLVKALVILPVTPIIVHHLGDTRNGIWLFISSITAYLTVGDFGVKSAIIRFVARYDAFRDHQSINRVINTSSAILSCMAAILLAITFLAAWLWRLPASIPAELSAETRGFFILSGIQMAVLLPIAVPQAALAGLGRFPLRNALSIVSLLLRQAAFVVVVLCGGGLVAVGVVLLANCALDYGMACWGLRRCFPAWTRSRRYVDRETLRTVCGYGIHVFAGDIAYLVTAQSTPLIIGICLASAASNTYFGLGASLKDYALSFLGMVVFVLVPAVSKWQAAGDHGAIRTLLIQATRCSLYFTLPIEFGLLALGYPFLALWMGPEYAAASYATLVALSVPLVLSAMAMVAVRVLQGIGKVRPLAVLTWAQAGLTVVLGALLAFPYGITGVACGVSLALALSASATIVLACRSVGVSVATLVRQALCGPLAASTVALAVWFAGNHWFPAKQWSTFAGIAILGAAPYAAIMLLLEPELRRATGHAARRFSAAASLAFGSLRG
jgi:O-antigen/teichoic acid export membrane protein